ncbi:MAG: peptide ABC transporter permease [SAR202 cluster bacterium Casp-Chloro-G2]|nr:MAG: peptide ABC transporter permease [SAR202 cluster bacterium Casp-Chloro-G2]
MAVCGGILAVLLAVAGLTASVASPHAPERQDYDAILASPSADHPLGTDRLGRDTLSRLLYGARTSLSVGVLVQVVVLAIGLPVGLIAGFGSPRVDNLLMRGVDMVYAFPDLLLIILLRSIFGGSVFTMFLAIGLASWPTIARLVRSQTLSIKEREYILAAQSIGCRPVRIVLTHLAPNAVGPVIVAVIFLIPRAIFAEASLSYIGIGVNPPTPSWGSMAQEGYGVISVAFEQALYPVLAIMLAMLAFTLLGEGLRCLLDPKNRRRPARDFR